MPDTSTTETTTRAPQDLPGARRFDEALEALCAADAVTRAERARGALSLVPPLLRKEEGLRFLYERASRFDRCGGFTGTPWDRPQHLRPRLWIGSFGADAPYPAFESMNTLRLLAIALGQHSHEDVDKEEAREFLERALSLNPGLVLDGGTEADRLRRVKHHREGRNLLHFVFERLPKVDLLKDIAKELDDVMAQRPVWTHHVRATLRLVSRQPGASESDSRLLDRYVEAVLGPTPMSMRFRDTDDYKRGLKKEPAAVAYEAKLMGQSLRATGLACRQHAVLLRHARGDPDVLAEALGLDDRGRSVLEQNADLVGDLIDDCVKPGTAQTAYGLAKVLERGLLDRDEIVSSLRRFLSLGIHPDVEQRLQGTVEGKSGLDGSGILVGGILRVLGQPLGIGQGNNPTCQSARGISLWAQYQPTHLMELLTSAARDNDVAMNFEAHTLHSAQLAGGLAPNLDPELDPVSLVLVPHLDKLYDTMMKLAAARGEDAHKWVNPSLYGGIVPPGFSSCFNAITWQVQDHIGFVRKFFATYHPDHNNGEAPVYANPVGITVTDDRGRHLGLHAVTIQRVAKDARGDLRVYFYNPNNEGRQDWGAGAKPSVRGHGEVEGESSLPFKHFARCLYAFHHPVRLPGDPAAVPDEAAQPVTDLAKRTWGRAYPWP